MSHSHKHHDAHRAGQDRLSGQDHDRRSLERGKSSSGAVLMSFLACGIAIGSLPPVYPRLLESIQRYTGKPLPPILAPPLVTGDTKLAEQLSALEGRVQTLLNAQPNAASAAPAPGPAETELASLAKRLTTVEAQLQDLTASLKRQDVELNEQIAKAVDLQMRAALSDSRGLEKRLAVVLALQAGIINGRPFTMELDWLRQYSNDDITAAVTELLLPYAKRGVAPMIDLRDALDQSDFVDALRNAAMTDVALTTRAQRATLTWLGDLGLIQKPTPLPIDEILDEMRAAMARGQLSEALQASTKLQGASALMIAPWVTRAKARLMAEEIAQRLLTTTLQKN